MGTTANPAMMSLVDMMLPYGGSLLLFGGEFGLPARGPADYPLRFGDFYGALYPKLGTKLP